MKPYRQERSFPTNVSSEDELEAEMINGSVWISMCCGASRPINSGDEPFPFVDRHRCV